MTFIINILADKLSYHKNIYILSRIDNHESNVAWFINKNV